MTAAEGISIKRTRTMSILEKIELAIVEHLKSLIPVWVDVEAWPENPNDYDFAERDGALLVHYAGSRYADPQGQSTNQKRGMSWALVLKTRSLNGQMGAYGVLEDIRQAVQGWGVEGSGPARMVRDDLISEKGGVWQWEIIIAMPNDAVARREPRREPLMRPVTSSQTQTT